MKKTCIFFLCLVGVLILVSCDVQGEDISIDVPSLITDELLEDETSNYIEQIENIEFVGESSRNNPDLFENKSTFITNEYNVHLVFNESVKSLNDIEIQELIENLPFAGINLESYNRKSGFFGDKYYSYKVSEIHIQYGEDEFIVSSNKISKNELDYNPQYEYEREQREISRNKRYDVRVDFFNNSYILRDVTRDEIVSFHEQKYREYLNKLPTSIPGTTKSSGSMPIDWKKDVEYLKEYQ